MTHKKNPPARVGGLSNQSRRWTEPQYLKGNRLSFRLHSDDR